MEMQEAMDGICVDVNERYWVTRSPLPRDASYTSLMKEQFVNWNECNRDLGCLQCSQVASSGRAKAADNANWAIEIDAGGSDDEMAARANHCDTCLNSR